MTDNKRHITYKITCASGVETDSVSVSVKEGDSVTLHTDVETNQQEMIHWYFNDTRIAQISGDRSHTCTDVQCEDADERFRDRLKLDHETGSLTITNLRTTDSGVYELQIIRGSNSPKTFNCVEITSNGVSVSVMEGDSVTLHTDVETNQQEKIKWYFNNIYIAQITGDLSYICTDVKCEDADERFRDRLQLDNQTGSLTITNTTTTDSGLYKLVVISSNSDSEKIFNTVIGVSGADGVSVSVMEGDSVTLHTDVETNQQEKIKWYFQVTCIARINGNLSNICTDVQCNEGTERFRDRLQLDNQTGSLTITNINTTHSGEYKLEVIRGNNKETIFNVNVIGKLLCCKAGCLLIFRSVFLFTLIFRSVFLFTCITKRNRITSI
uniref:Ig-like domain-containing protein n=1 Tax=Sinocyclocheilus rhinocerous TaxID=307959 RepID=A0A673MIM2_9TELE